MNAAPDINDKNETELLRAEARARWGGTKAYQEYEQRSAALTESDKKELATELMTIIAEIGALRDLPPDDDAAQEKIAGLQAFITRNYYECTNEILSVLGQMYVSDERFMQRIDKAGGEGTAEFISRAIEVYCAK